MNNIQNFKGLGIALVTPFTTTGDIDWKALSRLIEFQIESGIDFYCVLGTTAETPTLSADEQSRILDFVSRQVDGRIPIMVGCSGNCTATLTERIKNTDFAAASAILSCVPYYNKPTQEGIYRHFEAVSNASKLPIILYNIPGRTGVNMDPSTTLRLAADFSNITGIKEASGNVEQIKRIINEKPEGFTVLSGDDSLAYELIKSGADGVISVMGNVLPKTFGDMIHGIGNGFGSEQINNNLSVLYKLLFKEGNPGGAKALLAQRGYIENVLRLPLVPVSQGTYMELKTAFEPFEK